MEAGFYYFYYLTILYQQKHKKKLIVFKNIYLCIYELTFFLVKNFFSIFF